MGEHFLQEVFGQDIPVEPLEKPTPTTPELAPFVALHKTRVFHLRQLVSQELEGQDYADE